MRRENMKRIGIVAFLMGFIIAMSVGMLSAQGYYPHYEQPQQYDQHEHFEQQRELQEDFLRQQLQNQLMLKDFYEFDRKKREREEKYD